MTSTDEEDTGQFRNDALKDALRALRVLLSIAAGVLVLLQPDSQSTLELNVTFIVGAMVLAAANLLANLSAGSALETRPAVQVVFDALLALTVMLAVDMDATPLVWIALVVPVLDASSAWGSQGAMTAWLAVSVTHIAVQLQTATPDDTSASLLRIAVQQLAAVGAIVIPASIIASRLRDDLERTSDARNLADERSRQLRSLGAAAEKMAGAESPEAVVAMALDALGEIGFARVDSCEYTPASKRWNTVAARGSSDAMDPEGDPLLDEVGMASILTEGIGPTDSNTMYALSSLGYHSRIVAGFATDDGRSIAFRVWATETLAAESASVESVGVLVKQVQAAWQAAHTFEALARWSQQLAHDARHDVLTGLPNRAELFSQLAELDIGETAILFLDLDGFKAVNDSIGHNAGDAVLVEVASRLSDTVGEYDVAVRLGGDEFVVVARPSNIARLRILALDIIAALTEPIDVGVTLASVGTSIGIAVGEPGETADGLLRRADEAMYTAKATGGSAHHVSSARPEVPTKSSGVSRTPGRT
ncbi:MAG: diguanylate cyclase [Actinomycetia bacterium]|nr:diguanylate cyclase [Actinomycetes bacterium]